VLIVCPSCRHPIRVVDLRPGRFTPRCPKCQALFEMTVPDERGRAPVITPHDPSLFAEPVVMEPASEPPIEIPDLVWPAAEREVNPAGIRPGRLPHGVPRFLKRHVLLRLLGSGPRGQAYLGLSLGLDETEVIKIQDPDRAANPVFSARFLREAYAASCLDHPNLARVRDLGRERGRLFAAVERMRGPSLAELLEEQPQLEPFQAAMLIVQAARGLRAAHEQGLWHRDVKPENLRLDPNGLLKVDDLGLEMTPSLAEALALREKPKPPPVPSVPAGAGSPVFMAPEQAADPAFSDGRADIYALGGVFYRLVTGRPPYLGQTAVELVRQHHEEALVPPREFAPKLPRPIAETIQTMLGKRLGERYPAMGTVVDVLENVLDLHGELATAQLDEAAESIGKAARAFCSLPARSLHRRVLAVSGAIVLVMTALLLYLGLWTAAAGIMGFATFSALAVTLTSGITHRSGLLRLIARAILGGGLRSWGVPVPAVMILLLASWYWGGSLPWFLLFCAGGLAAAFHIYLDRPLASERASILGPAHAQLRTLRARGHDERTLRELVAKAAGASGREFFQALFEGSTNSGGSGRRGFLPSPREALASMLQRHLEDRRDQHMTRLLEQVEEGRLEAAGMNLLTARRKARRAAKAMVIAARAWRDEQRLLAGADQPAASGGAPLLERLDRAASAPEPTLEPHEPQRSPLLRRLDWLCSFFLGRGVRFLLGGGLMVILATWLDASGILTFRQIREQTTEVHQVVRRAVRDADPGILRELKWHLRVEWSRLAEPVEILVPGGLAGTKLPPANLGVAVLILLFSLLSGRRLTGFLAILGAAVALFAPRWGAAVPFLSEHLDAAAQARYLGALLLVSGFLLPRRQRTE
jgi:hypothetical protein